MSKEPGLTVEEPKAQRVVRPVCTIAKAQAPAQACLRPAMWVPGVRNMHMARESWLIKSDSSNVMEKLLIAVRGIEEAELMEVHKVDKDRQYIEIFAFTEGCNWLDVVEITLHTGQDSDTTCAETVSFSSGLFPAWCPLSFLCNCCCCLVPFSGNGQNTRRLKLLRDALPLEVTVTEETKCTCCPS